MKSLVFETPVNSAEELVARISAAAGEIRNTPEMLSNVRRSMKRRSTRGLLATDHVILNNGQVTCTKPETSPPLLTTISHQWMDVLALDRFNVHHTPTPQFFSGTGLKLVTRPAMIQYPDHSATAAPSETGREVGNPLTFLQGVLPQHWGGIERCALWVGGIIGLYFFKNDEGHNVTVNGDRYRAMITNFFIPELNNHDLQELWFQQDGATCHTARATIDLLKDTFGDRLISRFGPVNWPPRSCDLTPLDYFLWCYVNALVYADKPQTLDHLEDNIRHVFADIRP
ncbi:uncharacterized protein TNCV_3851041 [Trichonephila clavipes]|nr:uncharacterized protein TNCV_3851041 [Trichonephila clavipes]